MLVLTRQQSREVDALAIREYGMSGLVLMENAGRGVVDVLLSVDPQLVDKTAGAVSILCGSGNNAGDGFVMARHLEIRGVRSRVVLLNSPEKLKGDALANFEILRHTNVPITDLSATEDLSRSLDRAAGNSAWLIDALLGTGAQGAPREPLATAIRWTNHQPVQRLAVDVPSGLDCDTGVPAAPCVEADHTCTFVAAKQGYTQPSAAGVLGQLHVVSIGTPPQLLRAFQG